MMYGTSVDVIVGGQFGSESKGRVSEWVARQRQAQGMHVIGVRVGGHNAGHVAYDKHGNKFALRTVPVVGVFDDDEDYELVIAAGSEVNTEVLLNELSLLADHGHNVSSRLTIDHNATWLEQNHIDIEKKANMNEKIGSTAKGVGAARADRLMRTARLVSDSNFVNEVHKYFPDVKIGDTSKILKKNNSAIILEGTQGYGLGLHGDHYPQCTSNDTRAIDFLAMAGISPWEFETRNFNVHIVFRMFPIRVAGNSGALLGETTWGNLGLEEERTTVTNLVRRVGQWDNKLFRDAVSANGGDSPRGLKVIKLHLSMVDQRWPSFAGKDSLLHHDIDETEMEEVVAMVKKLEREVYAEFTTLGTSPTTCINLEKEGI